MIHFDLNAYCSGCGACFNVCPVGAIKMASNSEGFFMPLVDAGKCVNCGKCDAVCPHLNREKTTAERDAVRGVWLYASGNDEVKLRSSSGAACYEMGAHMLQNGGSVTGCIWNEHLKAIHILTHNLAGLKDMQGSKYVQSDIGKVYSEALEQLKTGQRVLFTGTPCQATAMHHIACRTGDVALRDRLITVGVICHGVASPAAWESYKSYAGEKEGSPLVLVNFRDKSREGYKKSYCRYTYASGRTTYLPTFLPSSKYIEATLVYNLAMRNSCTHCDCKGINTGIDLIVGDWYAEYKGEGRLGTSCIVAFTDRGKVYAEKSLKGLRVFDYDSVLKDNNFIEKSVQHSVNRNNFFEGISEHLFWDNVEKLYPRKYKYKKILLKTGIYDFLKRMERIIR